MPVTTLEKARRQQRPREVSIYEVGPRDGLQNEPEVLSSDAKVELVTRLGDAGLRRIEVTSFVSPEWIPQLADGDEVARRVPRREGVRYSALVPNPPGNARFRASGLSAAGTMSVFQSLLPASAMTASFKPVAAES